VNDRFDSGMQVRREVLGDAHVDRAELTKTPFDAPFQQMITESAWGALWADDFPPRTINADACPFGGYGKL
jgi:4-carboxymuconolactone decarboxylase